MQLLVVLVIFLFVLAITFFTTKWIGGYQKAQMSNKNLKMIEAMQLGNNKYLGLLQIGEVYLVVGVGKEDVHPIAKLTKEELPMLLDDEDLTSAGGKEGFQDILNKIKMKKG